MITKLKTKSAFQLIETPAIDGMTASVFSIIALYPNGDIIRSALAYDVSRDKERAIRILDLIKKYSPQKEDFYDCVSELL